MSNGGGNGISLLGSASMPCAYCGNPQHSAAHHPILEALNRQTELLADVAHVLEPKRYRLVQETAEDGSGGSKATVAFDSWPGGVDKLWVIERHIALTNSTGSPTVGVFVTEALPSPVTRAAGNQLVVPVLNLRDEVDAGTGTVAVGPLATQGPVLVKGGETLVFQWASLSGGARCVARIQFRQAWQSTD